MRKNYQVREDKSHTLYGWLLYLAVFLYRVILGALSQIHIQLRQPTLLG